MYHSLVRRSLLKLMWTTCGLLALSLGTSPATAQDTWSLGGDFTTIGNPNGPWSYGSMPYAAGSPDSSLFSLYLISSSDIPLSVGAGASTIEGWYNAFVDPNVTHNYGDADYSNFGITWSPGEVSLGPGFNTTNPDAASAIRWTAPSDGLYDVYAQFEDNQANGSGADVYVYVNGVATYTQNSGNVPEAGPTPFTTALPVFLSAGQTLDFIVGSAQGPNNTELAVLISQVPTPSDTQWAFDHAGDWNNSNNWFPGIVPNSNTALVTLGTVTTGPKTVYTDSNVTVKSLTFDNSNSYIVAGAGTVQLEADAGHAVLNVVQGTHEIQARLSLLSDTDADIAAGATLEINNRFSLGGHTLTKSGSGALQVNNALSTGGGSIQVVGGQLAGIGSVAGDVSNVSGTVAPGISAGKLTVTGAYSQAAGGTLAIEIGGASVGQYDLLQVDQSATLGGTLALSLVNGFQPNTGDFFTVLTSGSPLAGSSFATINGNDLSALSAGYRLNTISTSTSVSLLAALPGDADLNKTTDFTDLGILLNNYNQSAGEGLAQWGKGDFNDDHQVDFTDLGILLNNYNQSVSLSAGASPVPEPGSLILAALAFGGIGLVQRRSPKPHSPSKR